MLKPYFETEGPFGVPMTDAQAKLLEERLKEAPREEAFAFRRLSLARGLAEWQPEGRCDVSWITEESPDRAGDVVLARGMDDAHFQLNPLVTLNHNYDEPPVGRSLWRKRVQEGTLVGIKAKTHYPARPATWSDGPWPPDVAFDLVQAGLLLGKSIGFVPLQLREPTADERKTPALKGVRFVIEKWLLVEYACCFLPMQPNAVVEEVLKAARTRSGGSPRNFAGGGRWRGQRRTRGPRPRRLLVGAGRRRDFGKKRATGLDAGYVNMVRYSCSVTVAANRRTGGIFAATSLLTCRGE